MSTRRDFLRRLAGGFIAGPSVLDVLARIEAIEPTGLMLDGFRGVGPSPTPSDLTQIIHEIYMGTVVPHLQMMSPAMRLFENSPAEGLALVGARLVA